LRGLINISQCLFCGREAEVRVLGGTTILEYYCENCGHYEIDHKIVISLSLPQNNKGLYNKHLISGHLRAMSEKNSIVRITSKNLEDIYSIKAPSLSEKIDKLLLYFYKSTTYLYQYVTECTLPAVVYAINEDELNHIHDALIELGYLVLTKQVRPFTYSLTIAGFERAESQQKTLLDTKQVFIAMWFDDSMREVYENYIAPAVRETDHDPLLISEKEYNGDICDQIIAEIRRSKFLIADFTGNRGGVYYEAGFAYGLGKPVIMTCREDYLQDVHFDINHNNLIVWKKGEDLAEKLTNRIRASITD